MHTNAKICTFKETSHTQIFQGKITTFVAEARELADVLRPRWGSDEERDHGQHDPLQLPLLRIHVRDHDEAAGGDEREDQQGAELPHVHSVDRHHVHYGLVVLPFELCLRVVCFVMFSYLSLISTAFVFILVCHMLY